jgi:hypothetical protein
MRVYSVGDKQNTPNFKASLATTKGARKFLSVEPFKSAVELLEKKLERCPETDVFVISEMPFNEAKNAEVLRLTSDPKYKNFLYDHEANYHDKVPFWEKENLKLSRNGKTTGFYINNAESPEDLSKWLFDSYKSLN